MTPWEEVSATGQLGPAGAALIYKLTASVARGRGMKPPDGHDAWSKDAVLEAAHDFIAGSDSMDRFVDVARGATDDTSFRRRLHAAVLNHLRSDARRTDTGKLVRRLTAILTESAEFISAPKTAPNNGATQWLLPWQPETINQVPDHDLALSISRIPVPHVNWSSEDRDAPLTDLPTFLTLLRTVLSRANGSMTSADLARVIATRIDHRRGTVAVELDAKDDSEQAVTDPTPDPGQVTAEMMRASKVFAHLSDRQKLILTALDLKTRDLGKLLGLGHSQAATLRQNLLDRIGDEFADDDDPSGTIKYLCRLCDLWVLDWTEDGGATS